MNKEKKLFFVLAEEVMDGYPKTPHQTCTIVSEEDELPKLKRIVFKGEYEECKEYIRTNCEHCTNCED